MKWGLKAELTTFVPYTQDKVELTKVTITNTADTTQKITSTVAIPMYARLHQILETTGM